MSTNRKTSCAAAGCSTRTGHVYLVTTMGERGEMGADDTFTADAAIGWILEHRPEFAIVNGQPSDLRGKWTVANVRAVVESARLSPPASEVTP